MFDDRVVMLWGLLVGVFFLSVLVGVALSSLGAAIVVALVVAVPAWALLD